MKIRFTKPTGAPETRACSQRLKKLMRRKMTPRKKREPRIPKARAAMPDNEARTGDRKRFIGVYRVFVVAKTLAVES